MSSSGSKRPHDDDGGKKRSGGKGGIRWDEQNLEENERIKKELNPRKIDEPKTPYVGSPMDTDEEGDLGSAMRPLSLDDPATAAAAAAAITVAATGSGPSFGNGTTSDEAGSSGRQGRSRGRHVRIGGRGWSDSDDRTVSPSARLPEGASPGRASRSPRFSDQYYGEHELDDEEEEEKGAVADPLRQEKRRRFKEARKQHYNMREQLARARELMQSGDEEGREDMAAAEEREVHMNGRAPPQRAEHAQHAQQQQPQAQAQQPRDQQQQQQPQANGVRFAAAAIMADGAEESEGHLDADVEIEHDDVAGRQRGGAPAARQNALTTHSLPDCAASEEEG